jgi:hypothetical protein
MKVKNFYGADVLIPFGDFGPDNVWLQTPDGIVFVMDDYDDFGEDFGKFSEEGYHKILEGWKQFQTEYYWDDEIYRWMPKINA